MENRTYIGYLVGYDSSNIFRIWVPHRKRVIRARDVNFDETKRYNPDEASTRLDVGVRQQIDKINPSHARLPKSSSKLTRLRIVSGPTTAHTGDTPEQAKDVDEFAARETSRNAAIINSRAYANSRIFKPYASLHPDGGYSTISTSLRFSREWRTPKYFA